MRIRFVACAVPAALLTLLAAAPDAAVRTPPSLEYEVKGAFLFNFLGFTEWPPAVFARPEDPIRLCIAGRDPFGPVIDNLLKGERIHDRSITVERLGNNDTAARCTMLFVPASAQESRWIGRAGLHTLTVGESDDFLERGGIIALALDGGRVRFDVNIDAAAARDIRISARVLRLARKIISRNPE